MTLQEAVELYLKRTSSGRCKSDCSSCPLDARAPLVPEKPLCGYLSDAQFIADYYIPQEVEVG